MTATPLTVPQIILTALITLPLQSFLYAELRLVSGTVWTAWLLHTLANAFGYALAMGGFTVMSRGILYNLFTPGTEGILYSALLFLAGIWLHRRRMRQETIQ